MLRAAHHREAQFPFQLLTSKTCAQSERPLIYNPPGAGRFWDARSNRLKLSIPWRAAAGLAQSWQARAPMRA